MPSKQILENKQAVVSDLAEKLKKAQAGVVVKYQGITVADDTEMRKKMREAGVEYVVMKNTLTGRACDLVGYGEIKEHLTGMNAIAIGLDDPVAPAKILKEYAEKIETFEIRVGFLEGKVIGADVVKELADIPSKETLLGRFLGSIQSPISGFARALQAVIDKEQGGEAPAAEEPAAAAE
ncbi:MAG: 50S ribosomal protein L10 [Firmicutes bacterium]|nr:50S ribosomal protein L10 [Bacillota bacterium]